MLPYAEVTTVREECTATAWGIVKMIITPAVILILRQRSKIARRMSLRFQVVNAIPML
jgi:hypothetical protein